MGRKYIQINYTVPIKAGLSNSQNISIFQSLDDNNFILREAYSAQSDNCQFLEDNTLLLNISSCAFNQPNSTYYIVIDTGFVIHRETLEPLLGIYKDIWKFKTGILIVYIYLKIITNCLNVYINNNLSFVF